MRLHMMVQDHIVTDYLGYILGVHKQTDTNYVGM